jgi:hypothetical protein
MMAGLAQGLDQVREVGLNLTFGSSALEMELAVGCADAAAAKKMSDGAQGFVSMMQMMAAQNPSSAPAFLGKLKAGATGKRFQLATTLTQRDIELALQNVSPGFKPAKPTSAPKRPPQAPPAAEAAAPPVALEFLGMLPNEGEQLRRGKMRIKNSSSKAVQDLRVTYQYLDGTGHKIGEWTRTQRDSSGQILVRPGSERLIECLLFEVPLRTEQVTSTLREVTFEDGERWTPAH